MVITFCLIIILHVYDCLYSTETVRGMSLRRRDCIRHDEDVAEMKAELNVTMEIFKNYSRPSCLLECRARHLDAHCGCLPYYFPNFGIPWKKNISCGIEGLKCLARMKTELNALQVEDETSFNFTSGAKCECPNTCTETLYQTELSQIELRKKTKIMEKVY